MYHNPFSRATKQPKIPDGKVTESLGFQTQSVLETIGATDGDGVLHMLLYPGQDAGLIISGDQLSAAKFGAGNKKNVVGFTGSSGLNWTGVTPTGGIAQYLDKYAQWRIVSQGLMLALLNPAEEDDGWWESVRITEPLNTIDYQLTTKDATGNNETSGTIAPTFLIEKLKTKNLVNERSYATGLLRDLNRHMFTLHAISDNHDFNQQSENHTLRDSDVTALAPFDNVLSFSDGSTGVQQMINRTIDKSFDMIYVRCYGRSGTNKSRLHVNVVSNQEITFGIDERESRFHTGSHSVGSAMDAHVHASRMDGSSAHVISVQINIDNIDDPFNTGFKKRRFQSTRDTITRVNPRPGPSPSGIGSTLVPAPTGPYDVSTIQRTAHPLGVKALTTIENYLMPGSDGTLTKKFMDLGEPTPQIDFIANTKLSRDKRVQAMQFAMRRSQAGQHIGLAKGVIKHVKDAEKRKELADTAKFGYETWSAVNTREGKYRKITGDSGPRPMQIEYDLDYDQGMYPQLYLMPEVEEID